MVGKLGYVHQVVCHARHYLTRLVVIVELVGQLFKMVEHIRTHLRLHTHAHYVSVILYEKLQKHSNDIEQKQSYTKYDEQLILTLGKQLVKHITRNNGIGNSYQ